MRTKLKLGTNISFENDLYFSFLCEIDERGEPVNVIALGTFTLEQCAKARDAIETLNKLRENK